MCLNSQIQWGLHAASGMRSRERSDLIWFPIINLWCFIHVLLIPFMIPTKLSFV